MLKTKTLLPETGENPPETVEVGLALTWFVGPRRLGTVGQMALRGEDAFDLLIELRKV